MTDPQSSAPVEVTNPEPIPVTVSQGPDEVLRVATAAKVDATADATKAAAKVDADMLRTEDQRRISGIWERTQQVIALAVVLTSLAVSAWLTVSSTNGASTSFVFLASVANLVIGFYFGRTNHTRAGGVGPNEQTR